MQTWCIKIRAEDMADKTHGICWVKGKNYRDIFRRKSNNQEFHIYSNKINSENVYNMEYFVLIYTYVHSSYIPTEKKEARLKEKAILLVEKKATIFRRPSVAMASRYVPLLTRAFWLVTRRGMAKLGWYPRRKSSSQSEFCGSRFYSSCEKTKSDSICP